MSVINSASGCLYISIGAQSLAWTHILPFMITLTLTAASIGKDDKGRWGKEIVLVLYGFYLYFWQYALWVFQECFKIKRPDPFCSDIHTYAFPSQEAFYVASLVTFIVLYTFLWKIELPAFYWLCLQLFIIFPPIILVWFLYNRWWEVLFSMGLGSLVTIVYVITFRIYLLDLIPYMLHQAPWTWLSCIDSWTLEEKQRSHRDRIEQCLLRKERNINAIVR